MSAAVLIVGASVAVVVLFLAAVWRAYGEARLAAVARAGAGVAVWCGALAWIAGADVFFRDDVVPPPFAIVFFAIIGLGIWLGYGRVGRRIAEHVPVRWLVGFQAFRFAAEAALYVAYVDGIAPVQMTVVGNNKDVVTAAAATILCLVPALYESRRVLLAFNVLGLFNLGIIAVTAALSMPSPFRVYTAEPSQAWVTELPYIYLPGILVVAAFAGHFALLRATSRMSRAGDGQLATAR